METKEAKIERICNREGTRNIAYRIVVVKPLRKREVVREMWCGRKVDGL
jgi:hypothetical protein